MFSILPFLLCLIESFQILLFVFPQTNCYYHGEVEGHINSDVSLSICAGIRYVYQALHF